MRLYIHFVHSVLKWFSAFVNHLSSVGGNVFTKNGGNMCVDRPVIAAGYVRHWTALWPARDTNWPIVNGVCSVIVGALFTPCIKDLLRIFLDIKRVSENKKSVVWRSCFECCIIACELFKIEFQVIMCPWLVWF